MNTGALSSNLASSSSSFNTTSSENVRKITHSSIHRPHSNINMIGNTSSISQHGSYVLPGCQCNYCTNAQRPVHHVGCTCESCGKSTVTIQFTLDKCARCGTVEVPGKYHDCRRGREGSRDDDYSIRSWGRATQNLSVE